MTIADLFRFYVDVPSLGRIQLSPFNSTLRFSDEKRKPYRFYERKLLDSLILKDVPKDNIFDFQHLMDLERQGKTCERIDVSIDIYCPCDETWHEDWFTGVFRPHQGKWDVSNCTVTIPISSFDDTQCMVENWDQDINMFDYGEPVEITPFVGELQFMTCTESFEKKFNKIRPFDYVMSWAKDYFQNNIADNCLTDATSWGIYKHGFMGKIRLRHPDLIDFNGSVTVSYTLRTQWARDFVSTVDQPSGSGWVAVTGGWARPVAMIPVSTIYHPTDDIQPIKDFFNGTNNINIGALTTNRIFGYSGAGDHAFNNGRRAVDVLSEWFSETCGTTLVSNFLNINPDGTAPDNEFYDNAAIDAINIIMYQVTDIARIDETESATRGDFQIEDLINTLCFMFNLDIDIDSANGIVRIEHVTYWADNVWMDLTTPDHEKWIKGRWAYSYEEGELPIRERFFFAEQTDGEGQNFDGNPITYDNICATGRKALEETKSSATFLTNALFVFGNEDFRESTSILLISTDENNVINSADQVIGDPPAGSGGVYGPVMNGNLALGYLLPRYHTYGRPYKEGYINKTLTQFYATRRQRKQVPITMPFQCDDYINNYRPANLIKTQLGAGQISKAEMIFPDNVLTINLSHK